jgi:hypothetical protein
MFANVVRARVLHGEVGDAGKEVAIKIVRHQESMYVALAVRLVETQLTSFTGIEQGSRKCRSLTSSNRLIRTTRSISFVLSGLSSTVAICVLSLNL